MSKIGDDDEDPIFGLQQLDSSAAHEILGALKASPAFQSYVKNKMNNSRPVLNKQPLVKTDDDIYPELPNAPFKLDEDALTDLMKESPKLTAYAEKPAASQHPNYAMKQPLNKARDWQVPFGPVFGKKGTVTSIAHQPGVLFRGEKIIATDSWKPAGTGSRVMNLFVGSKLQMPMKGGGVLTQFFSNTQLGSGVKLDTCDPALCMTMQVSFIEDCTFDATIFGRAVL